MIYGNESAVLAELLERYPALNGVGNDIEAAYTMLKDSYESGGKVLCCGNGGSEADCDHIVGELMKGFLLKRPIKHKALNGDEDILGHLQGALPAVSLCSHTALLTAFANDLDFDYAYAQQVYALGRKGDVLIALSTSGNSAGVVNAVRAAGAAGVKSLAVTGMKESRLSELASVTIKLPETETFKIQELTLPLYHCLCAMLERHFFEN